MHRKVAFGYFLVLAAVAALNYVPGLPRPNGAVFGIFALDVYDDALHLASALWALAAALISARAARLEAGWTPPALPEGTRLVRKAAQERFVSTGLTREQSFALEANCLIRLNGAEAGRERRHFPLLAEADREGMNLATTWAGRSLDSLEPDRSVAVRDLPGQVEAIVAGLDRAGVIHLDLHASGKNLIVSEDGTLSLIDYGTAVLDRVPWSAIMREKLERFDEEGGYAGSAQRLRKMVKLCPGIRLLVLVLDCVGMALLHGAWPGLWDLRQAGLPLEEAGPIRA